MSCALTDDQRVLVLRRMAAVIEGRLDAFGPGVADPAELGLTALLAADLDRHLTALADDRYAPADDPHVLAIEDTVTAVRSRLAEWAVR